MPTYNGRCDSCGEFEDLMKASEYLKQGGLFCPTCKKSATTLIRKAPAIIGPMPSRTMDIDQIGQNFSSPQEKRAYFNRRKDRMIVSKNDPTWTNHYDSVRNGADQTARKQGFRDHEDRQNTVRKENSRRQAIARGDKKIQV
jgi:putative FmdB family regulatory protein|tara:strand:- start:10202 stop:10627 length:426 start_codon:yes stop_codon:yes gene_type:complete